jgi:O-antigen ligase
MVVTLAVYAGIAVMGVPFALLRSHAFKSLQVLPYGIALTIALMLVPPRAAALDRLTRLCVTGALFVSIAWLLQAGNAGDGRLTSSGSYDPNDLAAMMCMFIPLAMGVMVRGKGLVRVLGLASTVVFMLMIVLTSSRGGLVGLSIVLLSLLFSLRPSRAIRLVIVAVPLLVGGWIVSPAQFKERAQSLLSVEEDYNMTLETGRVAIWKRGWMHFKRRPILGVGIANYSVAEGNYFQESNKVAAYFTAHNTYVQAFVELGFFGGCALLTAIGIAVRGAWRASRPTYNGRSNPFYRPEYLAMLLGYFSAAFFLSHAYVYLLFGALGIGALVRNVHRFTIAGRA